MPIGMLDREIVVGLEGLDAQICTGTKIFVRMVLRNTSEARFWLTR